MEPNEPAEDSVLLQADASAIVRWRFLSLLEPESMSCVLTALVESLPFFLMRVLVEDDFVWLFKAATLPPPHIRKPAQRQTAKKRMGEGLFLTATSAVVPLLD